QYDDSNAAQLRTCFRLYRRGILDNFQCDGAIQRMVCEQHSVRESCDDSSTLYYPGNNVRRHNGYADELPRNIQYHEISNSLSRTSSFILRQCFGSGLMRTKRRAEVGLVPGTVHANWSSSDSVSVVGISWSSPSAVIGKPVLGTREVRRPC